MKKIISVLMILGSFSTYSQKNMLTNEPIFPLPMNDEGRVVFEGVVEMPERTKAELYDNARSWLATAFRSSKSVIDYSDKESGKIICKVVASSYLKGGLGIIYKMGYWHYTLTFLLKDGKYKYIISDFTNEDNPNANCKSVGAIETSEEKVNGFTCPNRSQLKQMKTILAVETSGLVDQMKEGLKKKSVEDF